MAVNDFFFEKKVSLGNVVEIAMLIGALVFATAYVKSDVDKVKKDQIQLQIKIESQEVLQREQVRLNDQTYVRKDVFDQVMKQLEDIKTSIQHLDAKVSK